MQLFNHNIHGSVEQANFIIFIILYHKVHQGQRFSYLLECVGIVMIYCFKKIRIFNQYTLEGPVNVK